MWLDVIVEHADIEGDALLGQRGRHMIEDLGMRHRRRGEGEDGRIDLRAPDMRDAQREGAGSGCGIAASRARA